MSIKFIIAILMTSVLLSACQEDLLPSNDPLENTNTIKQGSIVEDLSYTLSDGSQKTFSSELSMHDAVVIYFTMWCPVCDSHMSHIRNELVPEYTNVKFILLDYVSGSIAYTLDAQQANGYLDFDVIADYNNQLEEYFNGTMATTVVIDKNFIVKFKGLFKTTSDIKATLDSL